MTCTSHPRYASVRNMSSEGEKEKLESLSESLFSHPQLRGRRPALSLSLFLSEGIWAKGVVEAMGEITRTT